MFVYCMSLFFQDSPPVLTWGGERGCLVDTTVHIGHAAAEKLRARDTDPLFQEVTNGGKEGVDYLEDHPI